MGGNAALKALDDKPKPVIDDHHLEPDRRPSGSKQLQAPVRRVSLKRNAPTAFFLRTEEDLQRTRSASPPSPSLINSDFGITSIASSTSSTSDQGADTERPETDRTTSPQAQSLTSLPPTKTSQSPRLNAEAVSSSPPSPRSCRSSPVHQLSRELSLGELSRPLTPYHLRSFQAHSDLGPASTPQSISLRSLRLSDDDVTTDDGASQAIASDDELEEGEHSLGQDLDAPQLVMPSMRMPSRRPFTERGNHIGKLKILVAGSKGSGKSTLIKSIVQSCENIVHVDPLSNTISSLNGLNSLDLPAATDTSQVVEILASTRAYPTWWSELEDNTVIHQRRRNSINEPILDRNISFIDTPGSGCASKSSTNLVCDYVEHQLLRNLSLTSLSDGEILKILGGNGGVQVDLVLYLVSSEATSEDINAIRRLSSLSNVVPIVNKSDLLSDTQILEAVTIVSSLLHEAGVEIVDLAGSAGTGSSDERRPTVWAVSSATTPDNDTMDASLLMNSQYVQPLAPSSLPALVEAIFDPETTARLRHLAAKKFLDWRRTRLDFLDQPKSAGAAHAASHVASPIDQVSSISSPSPSHVLVSRPYAWGNDHIPTTAMPYTLARLTDHKQREETLAKVYLARWAADLQRNLRSEREKYEALGQEERRSWLLEKWGDCTSGKGTAHGVAGETIPSSRVDMRDPLGLLAWDDSIRRRGLIVAKVMGSCGIIGAIVVWLMRTTRWTPEEHQSLNGIAGSDHSWSQAWFESVR